MVRTQLIQELKKEISHYLGIPYWCNVWNNLILQKEGPYGGKGTYQEIEQATKNAAEKEGIANYSDLTNSQIYNLRKRNHIGIDCSGLCYHLLNKLDCLTGGTGILYKVTGVDKPFGVLGVRTVSANELTHPQNATKLTNYQGIKPGDLIRLDNGKHVIFIIEKIRGTINYVHSSDRTKSRGVHLGTISIINPKMTLDHQKWSDTTINGQPYTTLFKPTQGDGIFRPKFLTSLQSVPHT